MPYTLKMIVIFDLRKSQGQFLEHRNLNINLTKRLYAPSSQKQTHSKSTFI